ncbi:hypothetical protein BOTBODRAFT_356228 [Botryobasidium botryosum FD-172 SS1]|uniref:Uncharacterized protein n=1 Tax=Botryobasidium botryosum (strain FD-172 SS1) TaxID=930990 RepID=A0A067MQV8_BOTB1|nr:hypothetical protein BOTBODRAFT_356228 [Botryobasidium botryosum FD-172 SS1]
MFSCICYPRKLYAWLASRYLSQRRGATTSTKCLSFDVSASWPPTKAGELASESPCIMTCTMRVKRLARPSARCSFAY